MKGKGSKTKPHCNKVISDRNRLCNEAKRQELGTPALQRIKSSATKTENGNPHGTNTTHPLTRPFNEAGKAIK